MTSEYKSIHTEKAILTYTEEDIVAFVREHAAFTIMEELGSVVQDAIRVDLDYGQVFNGAIVHYEYTADVLDQRDDPSLVEMD
jgi:hypothetical protein